MSAPSTLTACPRHRQAASSASGEPGGACAAAGAAAAIAATPAHNIALHNIAAWRGINHRMAIPRLPALPKSRGAAKTKATRRQVLPHLRIYPCDGLSIAPWPIRAAASAARVTVPAPDYWS